MKLFLKKILLFICISASFLFVGILLPKYPGTSSSYMFAELDKEALLKNTDSPRIIFIGGSNLALGLNGQIVKDSLGLNPINMGLECNMGLTYMFENVLQYVRKGDRVIVASEYEQFFGRLLYGGYPCPVLMFEVSPWHWRSLTVNQWQNLITLIPGYALPRLKIWKYFSKPAKNVDGIYTRTSFNQFGDHSAHWQLKGKNPIPTRGFTGTFNNNVIRSLQNFQIALRNKGAYMFISFPPYQSASFDNNAIQIKQVEDALKNEQFALLGTPEKYKMADSLMFDSPYHLVKEGVDKRTRLLIADMKTGMLQNNR